VLDCWIAGLLDGFMVSWLHGFMVLRFEGFRGAYYFMESMASSFIYFEYP